MKPSPWAANARCSSDVASSRRWPPGPATRHRNAQPIGKRWLDRITDPSPDLGGAVAGSERAGGGQSQWTADLAATPLGSRLVCNEPALAGLTAMQQWGVRGFEADDMHVLVPQGGRVLPVDDTNVVVHESRRFSVSDIWHGRAPQLVSLPRAAMDAAIWAEDLWTAMRIFVAPVQQRRSLALDMQQQIASTTRVRRRRELLALANDLCGGAQALSEVEFLRFCRRHRLPRPVCQRRMDSNGRWRYLDATFRRRDGSLLRVEIDGGVHLTLAVRTRDTLKDNWASLEQRLVLRFTSVAIYADDPEAVAQLRRGLAIVSD